MTWVEGRRREHKHIYEQNLSFPHYSNAIQNTLPEIHKMFCKKPTSVDRYVTDTEHYFKDR